MYVTSAYCGKELGFFLRRLDRQAADGKRAPLIVPVLWESKAATEPYMAPCDLADVTYDKAALPENYARDGLRTLILNSAKDDPEVSRIVASIADRVIAACRDHPLEPWPDDVDVDTLHSVFDAPIGAVDVPAPCPPRRPRSGPSVVHLITAACDRTDTAELDRDESRYGDVAEDWRPYEPDQPLPLAYHAQGVAHHQGLVSKPASATADLLELISAAAADNEIVAVLVDAWAAQVPRHIAVLEAYDGDPHYNACTLVPWNLDSDEQTVQRHPELLKRVRSALATTYVTQTALAYRDDIHSLPAFEEALGLMLVAAQDRVIRRGDVRRPPDSAGPSAPPRLTGPVGR